MRFYELAAKIGLEEKNYQVLLDYANQNGYAIKNSLASVDDNTAAWVEGNSSELPRLIKEANEKVKTKKSRKRRVPARRNASKETKGNENVETQKTTEKPVEEVKTEEVKPDKIEKVQKQAVVKEEPKKVDKKVEKKVEKSSKAPDVKRQPAAKSTKNFKGSTTTVSKKNADKKSAAASKKASKPVASLDVKKSADGKIKTNPEYNKNQNKKSKKNISKDNKKSKGRVAKNAKTEVVLDKSEVNKDAHTTHKFKRADFKGQMAKPELPAIFAAMDSEYTRSIRSTGSRKRPGGRGRGSGKSGVGQGISGGKNGGRRGGKNNKKQQPEVQQTPQVFAGMSMRDLSAAFGVKINLILGFMMKNGQIISVNDVVSEADIVLIAEEFKVTFEWKEDDDLEVQVEKEIKKGEEIFDETEIKERPPVVTFMGHVDHGKTSLLDKVRDTRVAAGEHGGITQHIGAYSVEQNGQKITFLDTPGHEAFTQMRARGANLTDVAVLVVAADDGVMPQTKEAYAHAKNAGVPVVVAINKCDLPNANPDKVKQELSNQLELLPEEWGGSAGIIEVSAHTGQGISELLERILLESEMLELSANPKRKAVGYVIESEMTENRGVVATILINDGTLHRGDVLLTSNGFGKVKLMYDWTGATCEFGGPSQAVSVVGLNNVPEVGDKIFVIDDLVKARKLAGEREKKARAELLSRRRRKHVTLENLTAYLKEGNKRELNVIIKSDVSGSLEVLEKTLTDLSTDEVSINIIHAAVGGVSNTDVLFADASDAIIVGFHVVADSAAKTAAAAHSVQIKVYHVIYRLIEDMKAALEGMLPPEEKETVIGQVEIREVFRSSKLGNIAGCYVTDGLINRGCQVRLIRESIVIYDGKIDGLKRFKDDAKEVRSGFECGLRIVGYDDIKVGDVIEAYEVEEVARKLDD